MANFSISLAIALNHEGIYSNNPEDSGGETVFGISRNNWENWIGWQIVDNYKPITDEKVFKAKLINNATLYQLVHDFYIDYSWEKICGDEIDSQLIANKLFDQTLPLGVVTAIKIMQQACDDILDGKVESPEVDGILGSITLGAINGIMASTLLPTFVKGCIAHYQANSNPDFVRGLINRANA